MQAFDIYISYIEWESGGKYRPILVLEREDKYVIFFTITTQFESKNKNIRDRYFQITDWVQAGLNKPSYIDTNSARRIKIEALNDKLPIGSLSTYDVQMLIEFVSR